MIKAVSNLSILSFCFFLFCVQKLVAQNEKLVVLTFDDGVKSHLTQVAPVLKKLDFGATFFVTYQWMDDSTNFLTWPEIKELNDMGFEIGNHTWSHADFSQPKNVRRLAGELGLIEWMLAQYDIPKPISYAHPGNAFSPEVLEVLREQGYLLARRGKQPEIQYGELKAGPGYQPDFHHPLLIPSTLDFYPDMTIDAFLKGMASVAPGEIAVLQFHGVPDLAHPWVNTEPAMFEKYMNYLAQQNYQVIAVRDLLSYLPVQLPDDPLAHKKYPERSDEELLWPQEVLASRSNVDFWMKNLVRHQYTNDEMADVFQWSADQIDSLLQSYDYLSQPEVNKIEIWPYPGVRHPRIDFREGMLSPMRGSKLSIFLPWKPTDYIVLDLPEAVSHQYGLAFLGHSHIPTTYDAERLIVENSDWTLDSLGQWTNHWLLPGQLEIKPVVSADSDKVLMQISLTNHSNDSILRQFNSQVCVMLGAADDFQQQTNENKILNCPLVAVESEDREHWVIHGWEGCYHPWGNADCPCIHADPRFPDCAPGETVNLRGILTFYKGNEIANEMQRVLVENPWLKSSPGGKE